MRRRYFILAIVVELLGLGLLGVGIGYEAATGAHWGYVIISVGGWFVAGGAVIFGKFMKSPWKRQ